MPRENRLGADKLDLDSRPRAAELHAHPHAHRPLIPLPPQDQVEEKLPSLALRLEGRLRDADGEVVVSGIGGGEEVHAHSLGERRDLRADRRPRAIRRLPIVGTLIGADPDRARRRAVGAEVRAGRLEHLRQIGRSSGGLRLGERGEGPR